MQAPKSIKKNMFMSVLLTTSNFLFPLITYSYVARTLTPVGIGKTTFVNSVLQYFSYVAVLGIPAYGVRECAKVRDDRDAFSKTVKELLIINIFSTSIAYLGLIITICTIPKISEYKELFGVMGWSIFLNSIGMEWVYQSLEEYSYITKRSLVIKIISVILTFILIRSSNDVLMYGFLTIFSSSASNICNFLALKKHVYLKKKYTYELKRHLKPIFSLFTASIIITIYANFDISMLGFISTEHEIGLYNSALKIKSIILSVSTAVTAVIVPRMAYYLKNNDNKLASFLAEKSLRVSMILAFPLAVYIYIFADKCLLFLCGEEFLSASGTLRVLMMCIIPLILTNLFGNQILIPCGNEQRYSQSVFIGMWINLILNTLLIPKYGAFGAAIGTLVTEWWNVVWMSGGAAKPYRKMLLKHIKFEVYIIAVLVSIIMGLVVNNLFKLNNVIYQLMVTSVVFFGSFYICLIVFRECVINQQLSGVFNKIKKQKK